VRVRRDESLGTFSAMRRFTLVALLAAAVLLSGCAVAHTTGSSAVEGTRATLEGNVFAANAGSDDYWFEYGSTTDYGEATGHRSITLAANEARDVSATVSGLETGTTYHFRACAQGPEQEQPACGEDRTLRTADHDPPLVTQVSAGFDQTCAIVRDGAVRCWGPSPEGQVGIPGVQGVGDWSGDPRTDEVPPVDLGAGRTAIQISSGWDHTCALLDNHEVICWGAGPSGLGHDYDHLGQGFNIGDDETPASVGPVDLGGGHKAKMVAAGGSDSCAILDDDSVKCWGQGTSGVLGYGNGTGQVFDPSTVGTVDLGPGRKAASIDTAANHTCVILTTGDVMCWGDNNAGKLGYGSNSSVIQAIGDDETPASVGTIDLGGHSALKVTGGDNHTCALLDDHTVRCWGTDYRGINGDPTGQEHDSPPADPLDLGAGRTAIDLEAAADHTCAVLDDHTVRCWGFGSDGRLGYGNTNDVGDDETPGSPGPINLGPGRTAEAVSAGRWHSCALMDDGNVRCWGEGSRVGYGNNTSIGDDETPDTAGPVPLGP
jgi:alpha-tubulin suppressor-like RCC1 family protein